MRFINFFAILMVRGPANYFLDYTNSHAVPEKYKKYAYQKKYPDFILSTAVEGIFPPIPLG